MKHRKQLLIHAIALCLISLSFSLPAQTNNFQAFLKKAQQYESGYLQKDTVMRMPFIGKQSEVNWYYEIQFEGQDAIFLEQVFYGFNQRGHQMICKCETEKALQQLEKQLAAWQSSSFHIDMSYANFQQRYCLNETIEKPLSAGTSKIKKLLKEQAALPLASPDGIKVSGRWLKAEDGHWILDLSGDLPKGYAFLSFAEDHEMHYVKGRDKEAVLYPPAYAPEWQKQLISSGRFGKNIINDTETRNYNLYNQFAPFSKSDYGQDWNILFHLKDTMAYKDIPGETQGIVYITALTDSIAEATGPIPGLWPNEKWDVSCDGKTINIVSIDKPNQGTYSVGGNMNWERAIIKDKSEKIIAEYTIGNVGKPIQLMPKEEGDYMLTVSWKKLDTLVLPFRGAFPVVEEYAFQQALNEPVFKYFARNDNGVRAEYVLAFPPDTQLKHFEVESVMDDKGKELILPDKERGKEVRTDFESYVKHVNRYQLNMGYFDLPSPDANQIIIVGNYQTAIAGYTIQSKSWTDTLHLAKGAIAMETGPKATMPDGAITAAYIQMGSMAGGLPWMGVSASIPFQYPEEYGRFYGVDYSKSEVLELYDNKGHDLIAGHRSTFESRLNFTKTSSTSYYSDEALNDDKMFMLSYSYPNPNIPPLFNLRTYVGAGDGADKIFGKASIVYHTFVEGKEKKISQPLHLMMQPSIAIVLLDGHSFNFKSSSFETDAKDGREFTTYRYEMPEKNATVYPSAIILRDASGEIVSLQAHEAYTSNFEPYNITFPEGEWGEYTVEIVYHELEEHAIEVPFVITLGRE